MVLTVSLPQPYLGAIEAGQCEQVADAEAATSWQLFGRGWARAQVGRRQEARADFAAARAEIGDPAILELAFLDLDNPVALTSVAETTQLIAERAAVPSLLAARAEHIGGIAESKLGRPDAAFERLRKAVELYENCDHEMGRAAVLDSMGVVLAEHGRLVDANHYFAMALAAKALIGDRAGITVSLANLGRSHLETGQFDYAIDCLQVALTAARDGGDHFGEATSLRELARVHEADGERRLAIAELEECQRQSRQHHYTGLWFDCSCELARLLARDGQIAESQAHLDALTTPAADQSPLDEARRRRAIAARLAAEGNADEATELAAAAAILGRLDQPSDEAQCRLELAEHFVDRRQFDRADESLSQAIDVVRRHHLDRFRPTIERLMKRRGQEPETRDAPPEAPRFNREDATRFLMRRKIGAGGFGEVHLVYDVRSQRDVALKVLNLSRVYDGRVRRRLERSALTELRAGQRLTHPGIARIEEIGQFDDGRLFVVQEFVPGRSLAQLMNSTSRVALCDVLPCLIDVANALGSLHEASIIHRDIKPSNIMIRDDNRPVLIDLGVAHFALDALASDHVMGTLPYMSPEQVLGKRLDGRSDLFSLGVVAFEWLSGVRPFPTPQRIDDLDDLAVVRGASRSLVDFRPDLPPEAIVVLTSLMAHSRRRRPKSGYEAAQRLQMLLDECGNEPR